MKYYIDDEGNRRNTLPRIWNGITPFNELRATEAGWTIVEEVEPEPVPEDTTERDSAERQIVHIIVGLASQYNALEELAAMDITIPNLTALADAHNVPEATMLAVETRILILARHLEAITGLTWAETWEGLKARFMGYVQELNTPAEE